MGRRLLRTAIRTLVYPAVGLGLALIVVADILLVRPTYWLADKVGHVEPD